MPGKSGEMMKKQMMAAALAGAVLLLSGCGAASVEDQYVFGSSRVTCGGDTITLSVPFELAVKGKQSDLAPKNGETVTAVGSNRGLQVVVVGNHVGDDKDIGTVAASSEAAMENNSALTGLKTVKQDSTVDGEKAVRLTFTFREEGRGGPADLTAEEYIFRRGNALWRVIYQYRTEDPAGKALYDKVAGKITFGAKIG